MTAEALEAALEAGVPEYLAELRASPQWAWERDGEETVFLLLEHLRLWLFALGRGHEDARERAWATVETLAPTTDPLLLNALMVGLLEGHWSRRDRRLMGPRTRALWDDVQAP